MVVDVLDRTAGQAAGLKRYDVITAVAGTPVEDGDQLVRAISNRAPGSDVALTVRRDGQEMTPQRAAGGSRRRGRHPRDLVELDDDPEPVGDTLGLVVADLSRQAQDRSGASPPTAGASWCATSSGSPPGADAITHGDVVVEVNAATHSRRGRLPPRRRDAAAGRAGVALRLPAPSPRHVPR